VRNDLVSYPAGITTTVSVELNCANEIASVHAGLLPLIRVRLCELHPMDRPASLAARLHRRHLRRQRNDSSGLLLECNVRLDEKSVLAV